jgi:hypothetical protein
MLHVSGGVNCKITKSLRAVNSVAVAEPPQFFRRYFRLLRFVGIKRGEPAGNITIG